MTYLAQRSVALHLDFMAFGIHFVHDLFICLWVFYSSSPFFFVLSCPHLTLSLSPPSPGLPVCDTHPYPGSPGRQHHLRLALVPKPTQQGRDQTREFSSSILTKSEKNVTGFHDCASCQTAACASLMCDVDVNTLPSCSLIFFFFF